MEDVERLKPDPEGIHFLLGKADPSTALYLGDMLDDALAAQARGRDVSGRAAAWQRGASRARQAIAVSTERAAILHHAKDLEKYWK